MESKRELFNRTKISAAVVLILLASAILATMNPYVASVKAEGLATVNVLDTIGGSTDPAGSGTYNYSDGTPVSFTAVPETNFGFFYWVVSSNSTDSIYTDNPLVLTVAGDNVYDVQAIFNVLDVALNPTTQPENPSGDATVIVIASAGGTTDPQPGTYTFATAETLKLTATPDSGWVFDHWVISGGPLTDHGGYPFTVTPTDNPYTVGHGYGYTYDYQPVFVPVGSTIPPPPTTGGGTSGGGLSTETITIIAVVVVIVIILVAVGAYAYTKRSKK